MSRSLRALALVGCALCRLALPAELAIDNPVWDAGTVQQGRRLERILALSNTTDHPVTVSAVITSCGCTSAEVAPAQIGVGKAGALVILCDTTGLEGEQEFTVSVYTAAQQQEAITAHLRVTVRPEFRLSAKRLVLGPVDKLATLDVEVVPPSHAVPSAVSFEPDVLTGSLSRTGAPGGGARYRLAVSPKGDIPQGQHDVVVTVRTTSEDRPELRVGASLSVPGPYVVDPPRVSFGIVAAGAGEPLTRVVQVSRRDAAPSVLWQVVTSDDWYRVEWETGELRSSAKVQRFRVTLKLPELVGKDAQLLEGAFVVVPQGTRERGIRVPVIASLTMPQPPNTGCCGQAATQEGGTDVPGNERPLAPP